MFKQKFFCILTTHNVHILLGIENHCYGSPFINMVYYIQSRPQSSSLDRGREELWGTLENKVSSHWFS